MSAQPQVVIVGAGFGGLWAARAFAGANLRVLLIDRDNYHTFLPLLYQVAAAEVEPEEIVHPIRSILHGQHNADFLLAEVKGVDFATKTLQTSASSIHYDYLILAAGSSTNFYGVEGAGDHAYSLKSLDDAIRLRNHILCTFERAARETDTERRRRQLTFAIVGGGPTGVEYSGALTELFHGPMRRDFPKLNIQDSRVVLLESGERLLPTFSPRLGEYAHARLQKKGVDVHLKAMVDRVSDHAIHLRDGSSIPTETAVWTAGVRGEKSASGWGLPVDRGGRIAVGPTLEVAGLPGVYVIGDLAYSEEHGKGLPMLAQVAMQHGRLVAANIKRSVAGKPAKAFHYVDLGTMATIGRNTAVADIGGITLTGFPAWLMWLGVHLANLIGFRNRLVVLLNWAWDYFLFDRTVRLIMPSSSCREPAGSIEAGTGSSEYRRGRSENVS